MGASVLVIGLSLYSVTSRSTVGYNRLQSPIATYVNLLWLCHASRYNDITIWCFPTYMLVFDLTISRIFTCFWLFGKFYTVVWCCVPKFIYLVSDICMSILLLLSSSDKNIFHKSCNFVIFNQDGYRLEFLLSLFMIN